MNQEVLGKYDTMTVGGQCVDMILFPYFLGLVFDCQASHAYARYQSYHTRRTRREFWTMFVR